MAIAVALWSLELQPGKPETFKVPNDLRITNVALGAELQDENSRTSVKLTYRQPKPVESDEEDEEEEEQEEGEATTTVLCSLSPGKIEQALVDLILEEEQEVVFEVVGKNTVYLTGNYVDQTPPGGPDDQEDYSDLSEEEDYDIDELGSEIDSEDYEIEEEDDSHRFEEIVDEEDEKEADEKVGEKKAGKKVDENKTEKKDEAEKKSDSKKRPRESDAMAVDGEEPKLSKAEKKKLKKLKAENGQAVPAGETKEAEKPKPKTSEQAKEKEGKKEKTKETKELTGGVKIQDHKVGTGRQAKNGDVVSMRYVGKLQNGKVFDSNTKGKPFKFRLGKGEVIKGWDIGIAGMQVGGERLLIIPPAMGYGKQGSGPIPSNATLTFEVKLLGIN